MSSTRALGATITFIAIIVSQAPAPGRGDEPAAPDAAARQKRLDFLLTQIDRFQIDIVERNKRPLKRGDQPVLRWSNPVREYINDGVTFLYLEGARPRAIVTVWIRSRGSTLDRGELLREQISLSGERLTCRRDGHVVWSPKTGGLVDQPLAKAPLVASRPAQRLKQMRELARRFQAASYKAASRNELRLLSQPLYRYPNETAEAKDGALFAFVEGTDPEVMLLLEAAAVDSDKRYAWRYSLARSTTFPITARLDDADIFTVESYRKLPRTPEAPYVEVNDGQFTLDGDENSGLSANDE